MKQFKLVSLGLVLSMAMLAAACAPAETVEPAVVVPEPSTAKIIALSNDSPHITVINAETNLIIKTKDMAESEFLKWTWNDDNNHFDGTNVWLGLKYPEADDAVVIALNVNTLEEAARLPVGKEAKNIYIGKASKNGTLHVGKQASHEVVTINTTNFTVLETWGDRPVGKEGGVVCDADLAIGPDGVERFYYPTLAGDSVVSMNAETGEVIAETNTPDGSKPVMHTNAPDGAMWVQEIGTNMNAVFDAVTLDLVARIPAADGPVVATFSPAGKFAYIGHSRDPIVQVVDTETLTEVTRITVGSTPSKIAVHPNGKFIYAIASKEARVAVIDTSSWKVVGNISLGSNPGGLFLWED